MGECKNNQGKEIEKRIMEKAVDLMKDMQEEALTKEKFKELKALLKEQDPDDWLRTIVQFCLGKKLLAKQAVDLILMVGEREPFERIELALFVYEALLDKGGFQLVLNALEDQIDRENVLERLNLPEFELFLLLSVLLSVLQTLFRDRPANHLSWKFLQEGR